MIGETSQNVVLAHFREIREYFLSRNFVSTLTVIPGGILTLIPVHKPVNMAFTKDCTFAGRSKFFLIETTDE
jgi:hypothetical protein